MPDDEQGESKSAPDTKASDEATNTAINQAITAHLKRFAEKTLPTLLATQLESVLKPIHDKLAKPVEEEEVKTKTVKVTPEMQALQAQLEEFKTKFTHETAARVAAEKKSRDDKAQSELRTHLQPHVKPDLLDILTDHLYRGKGVVDFEEDGTPIFKSKKADGWGGEEDVRMPLRAGVDQFLKSNEAKPFMPAPGSASAAPMKKTAVSGGHSPGGNSDPAKMSDREKIQRSMEIAARVEQSMKR